MIVARRVKVVTTHAGRRPNNGGEYEFFTIFDKVKDGWEVSHGTSAEFSYCPVYGDFQECRNCWDWDDALNKCRARREMISDVDLKKELEECVFEYRDDLEEVYDGTGHEYTPCKYDGGCVICYPCGHGCSEERQ